MSLSFKIKQRTNERDVGGVGKYRGFQLGGVCSLLFVKEQHYRINWYISPPYVARARQMPSLRRGLIVIVIAGIGSVQGS
jgi:hypothetical protein